MPKPSPDPLSTARAAVPPSGRRMRLVPGPLQTAEYDGVVTAQVAHLGARLRQDAGQGAPQVPARRSPAERLLDLEAR